MHWEKQWQLFRNVFFSLICDILQKNKWYQSFSHESIQLKYLLMEKCTEESRYSLQVMTLNPVSTIKNVKFVQSINNADGHMSNCPLKFLLK